MVVGDLDLGGILQFRKFSLGVALAFASLALAVGLATGYRTMDVDEVAYRQTLRLMQAGDNYYDAMHTALLEKEGAPPSEVRAIRPPTIFLLLEHFPERSWRWLSGLPIFATVLLGWALAHFFSPRAGAPAAVLVGLWMLGASPYLFLHAEFWGLPLALGGLYLLATQRPGPAAGLLMGATLVRELYLVWLIAAFLVAPKRRAWWGCSGVVVVCAAVHAYLANQVLADHGYQPPLNGTLQGLASFFGGFSPSATLLGGAVGAASAVLGFIALGRLLRRPRSRRLALAVLVAAGVLLVLTTFAGRTYWGLTYGPILAVFAPLAFMGPTGSSGASGSDGEPRPAG